MIELPDAPINSDWEMADVKYVGVRMLEKIFLGL